MYQRVYYVNGRAYPRYYNPYMYHGVELAVYAPPRYYAPAFYGWAYNPWAVPVAYSFGFAAAPWYGFYGGYFAPYPVYAGPAFWLTDYMVAKTLEDAYAAQAQAQAQQQAVASQAVLTPDVKQQIAEEVKRQISLENAEVAQAQTGVPDEHTSSIEHMLRDNTSHVYVVATGLTVNSAAGQCAVTEGDVLQLNPQTLNGDVANLVVLASKGQDCQKGSMVSVGVADLQDMQNHMRETIDQGMGQLQASQGRGGLPALPASASAPPMDSLFAKAAPPPDPNGATQVAQEWDAGTKAEQTAVNDAVGERQPAVAQTPAPQANPGTVSLGQSMADVQASQGRPVGASRPTPGTVVYTYSNGSVVTFTNGRVTSMQ
jgi:hypothetical protein